MTKEYADALRRLKEAQEKATALAQIVFSNANTFHGGAWKSVMLVGGQRKQPSEVDTRKTFSVSQWPSGVELENAIVDYQDAFAAAMAARSAAPADIRDSLAQVPR